VSEERFGKFEVVGLLGRGGMAEVFLCRLGGLGGFNKEVVVKRILPERLADPAFLRMFLDEARMAANFNHPNIVQVYETGEAEGLPYIAMEYVRGPTLATVLRETVRAEQLHVGHVAKILSGVCQGLAHAHNALGPNREPLDLVHRDVSPQNIIIAPEGAPKLLDFGVAKARGRLSTTEAGTLKGKLRYMAPEQIRQGPLDHRADVFSVGVLLCEATTGRNPFGAKQLTEVQLFKNIVSGAYSKPSELVVGYPPELERIVLWAIEPDVNQRCPSAQSLSDALESFVASGPYLSSTRAVVAWMNEHVARKLYSEPLPAGQHRQSRASNPRGASRPSTPSSTSSSPSAAVRELGPVLSGPAPAEGLATIAGRAGSTSGPVPRGGRLLFAIGGLGMLTAVLLVIVVPWRWPVAPGAPAVIDVPAPERPKFSPDEAARTYLDEAERYGRSGRLAPALDVLARARELDISDPALNIHLVRLREEFETAVALRKAHALVEAGESQQAAEMAKVLLDRDPSNAQAVEILAAIRRARLPRSAVPQARRLAARGRKPLREGALSVTSSPPGLVYLDDELIGRAPVTARNLTPGIYNLQVRAPGHLPYESSIRVSTGRARAVAIPLRSESPVAVEPRTDVKGPASSEPIFPARPSPFETPPAKGATGSEKGSGL
jgi:serine/threonine protein kinase